MSADRPRPSPRRGPEPDATGVPAADGAAVPRTPVPPAAEPRPPVQRGAGTGDGPAAGAPAPDERSAGKPSTDATASEEKLDTSEDAATQADSDAPVTDRAEPEPEAEAGQPEQPAADQAVVEPEQPEAEPAVAAQPEPVPSAAQEEPAAAQEEPASVTAKTASRPKPRKRSSVRAGLVVAFLCGTLGFALAAQLQNNDESQFANARQSDLVRILDELNSREERLRSEIADLEFRRDTINSRAQGSEAALEDARRRTTELGILAGTLPAEGPGMLVTLSQKPGERLPASTILDTIEELRGAGAEAMQINGGESDRAVRIGASTYFADTDDGIEVDGVRLTAPYRITVIGDPPTMEGALKIPGGIVESVRADGGTAGITPSRTVQIMAVREVREPKFARPAS